MKTVVAVVGSLILVLALASVSSAQLGTVWQVTGLTTPVGTKITDLNIQLEMGIYPQFKVFGAARLENGDFPVYGSGFITTGNTLVITFTLVDAEIDLDVNLDTLAGPIKLYRYDGTYSDTNGSATLVDLY